MKRRVSIFIILGCIFIFGLIGTQVNFLVSSIEIIDKNKQVSYIVHAPITITHNDHFAAYGFSGNGSSINPFIIENLNITTNNDRGIYITQTSEYFIIRNCLIEAYSSGIYLYNIANGTAIIQDSICQASTHGIYLRDAPGTTVENSVCNNEDLYERYGIYLVDSSYSIIYNNTCNNNWYIGIRLSKSSNVILEDNNCFDNGNVYGYGYGNGIHVSYSDSVQLINNRCTNNRICDISLWRSPLGKLSKNTCNGSFTGIKLLYSPNSTLDYDQCSNHTNGIIISHSDFTILSNVSSIKNEIDGIRIYDSMHMKISNAESSYNNYTGIFIYRSSYCNLSKSQFSFNKEGLYVAGSSFCNLDYNECANNFLYGLRLRNSESCKLTFNKLLENNDYGLVLGSETKLNEIHHNSFINNNLVGSSQAFDEGHNNYWFDRTTCEGNYWSSLGSNEPYLIDGLSNSTDPYPLNEDLQGENRCTKTNYSFFLIVPFYLATSQFKMFKRRKR